MGVRMIRFMSQLQLMLTTCARSLDMLFWSLCFLLFVWWVLILVVVGALTPHLGALDQKELEIFTTNFASWSSGVIYFLRIATGEECFPLYQLLSVAGWGYQMAFLLYIFFYAFSMFNILTAMVVENLIREAAKDDDTVAI